MHNADARALAPRGWMSDKLFLGMSFGDYVRSLITPGNLVVGLILAIGLPLIVYRFAAGLAATTNLTQTTPWGIWIGFDMLSGVALAAGGYTLATAVYIFGLDEYHPIVRPAVLTGFLGYVFAILGLCADLGRPWNLPVPLFFSWGGPSVMFEIAWCVVLYASVLAMEFLPPVFEWLGWKKARTVAVKATIGLTVAGVMLSTLHQSSLGALFLMAPTKLHPLWYSPFIPAYFFISSIAAGLSMVIVESALSHRAFRSRVNHHLDLNKIVIGLARGASVVLFSYFFVKLQGVADSMRWDLLWTPYGYWFLFEVLGFVLLPCLLFAIGARGGHVTLIRWTAAWTVLGIIVNRLNVSIIAFNWNAAERYVPSWMEVMISVTLVTLGIQVFRWIVNRMPVLREDPEYHNA
ncbi:MAG: Ni/Fe-hydrogenase cytochrome b subunit [Vicinamibacterales bacterium]|nr:Ni/Fe-hydrogenase cytochrome b subunit [Vicinamibacterales bacterium]